MDFNRLFQLTGLKRSNSLKISLVLLSAILTFGMLYIYVVYYTQKNETQKYLNEVTKQSAKFIETKISSDITAMTSFVTGFGENDNITKADIIDGLEAEYKLFDRDMLRLSYILPSGLGYAITDGSQVNQLRFDLSKEEYQRAFKGETVISESKKDILTGEMVNAYYVPVYKNGQVIAIHCGINRTDDFHRLLSISSFDDKGYSVLFDTDVNIVSYNSKENEASSYNVLKNNSDFIKNSIRQKQSDCILLNDGNDKYWVTYSFVGINNWYVALVIPRNVVSDMTRHIEIFNYVIILLIILVCAAITQYIGHVKDAKDKEIIIRAYIDEKTNLLNKEGLSFFVDKILSSVNNKYALIYFDVDSFKTINDIFGYAEGDLLLKHCAEVISSQLKGDECAARFGGDNFYVFMEYKSDAELSQRIKVIMDKISEYNFTISKSGKLFDIIVYAGVYKISKSNRGKSLDFFVDRTDMSMRRIEKKHENDFAFYNDQVRKDMVYETELENEMRYSLENGYFEVYIQPKFDVKTQRLAGGEALTRWNHPEKGFLTPDKFIHIFEKNGMIIDLDMYVLDTVCKIQRQWLDRGIEPKVISVNQSRIHLYRKDYTEELQRIIKKYDLPPKYIELEITETVAITSTQLLSDAVRKMHQIGFRVSMDDFGSGQSALNLLKDIDIDVLKIDRSFFLENSDTIRGKSIIESVLDMATRLQIETVSEGVETMEQLEFLKNAGCNLVQSFLFSKPIVISEYEKLVIEDNKLNNQT